VTPSIGVQSWDNGSPRDGVKNSGRALGGGATAPLKAFPTVNVDLIFNFAAQSREMLGATSTSSSPRAPTVSLYPSRARRR
jgi:hypothetical protein